MKNILFVFLIFVFGNIFSQNYCGTNEALEKLLANDPKIKASYLKHLQEAKSQDSIAFLANYQGKAAIAPVYTIPIVFHILHQYGAENISDAQVIDQVNLLNRDYRKQNPDTISVNTPFAAADVRFEFRLPTKDPNGNCTNGIIRHFDSNTNNWTGAASEFVYTWNPSMYLNVYVVKQINGFTAGGYSSFPGTNTSAMGVIIFTSNSVGSIGTSNPFKSRLLTHEVGHWFDLHHIWGDTQCGTVCGDDGVSDTPITKGWQNCPSSASLSAVCNSTITENFQNYMDYSFCTKMFTAGQVARMTAAINSTVSGRNNLWTTSNLIATGIISPSVCPPIADFYSSAGTSKNQYTICINHNLSFTDASTNATISTWQWSGTGGAIISSPTQSFTSISFPTAGTQTVTLVVSNSSGSTSATRTVLVLGLAADITGSYQESFESVGLPANFTVINPDADVTWDQTSIAAATGNNCYFIKGFSEPPYANPDILETPSYDFLNNPNATFTFKYAYAQYTSSWMDVFKVQVSGNCGASWADLNIGNSSGLANGSGGTTTNSFVPTPSQFKTVDVTAHPGFSSFFSEPNVRFRFFFQENQSVGYGNNIYLDDINFNVPTGINELTRSLGYIVYPNPSNGAGNIQFILSQESTISYYVRDIAGRIVEDVQNIVLEPGKQSLVFNSGSKLQTGMYFIDLRINNQKISSKFTVVE